MAFFNSDHGTHQRTAEPVQHEDCGGDGGECVGQPQVQLVVHVGPPEGVDLGAEDAGQVEDVQECHCIISDYCCVSLVTMTGTEGVLSCVCEASLELNSGFNCKLLVRLGNDS